MPPFCRSAIVVLLCALGASHAAEQSGKPGIYSCTDAKGRRYTSDRPIPECHDREHRVLNADGSLRNIMPPAMSPSERADKEAREQQAAQARASQQDAARRERNLVLRYPTRAAHDTARSNAMDDVRQSIGISQRRLATLAQERQALDKEVAELQGKNLPLRLRQQVNANDAAVQAQKDLVQSQEQELVRLTGLFDAELAVLKRLWAGEAPGSSGEDRAQAK